MGQAATLPCRKGGTYVTELYEWFRKFLNECPSGLITLHEFRRHFCNGTAGKESAEYAEQIFRTLDNNGDGVVDFREYVTAISMLIEGTTVEKLRWSFKLYDKDKDGAITRSEMLEIMQVSVYKVLFLSVSIAIISQEEFIEGALNDEWIREMLECDPKTVKMERPLKGNAVL
uniref:Guanylyl cyclase inhibitory protein-like n=1 Tax=Sinocyclocheilus rhinocerous TaxID=307959 RepID=A0A673LJL3_9TELE